MSYQGALDYISAGREHGISDADISERLRGAGWHGADVQDAFALFASMGRVTEPVARLASTPMVMDQPVVQPQPTQPTPVVVAPVAKKRTRSLSLHWVLWIGFVIAAFVLGYLLM